MIERTRRCPRTQRAEVQLLLHGKCTQSKSQAEKVAEAGTQHDVFEGETSSSAIAGGSLGVSPTEQFEGTSKNTLT